MCRVTHVVFDLDGGGMETLVAAMAQGYRDSPIRISVISLGGRIGKVGSRIAGDVESYQVLKPTPVLSMIAPLGLAASLRRTRPDVVHLHSGVWYKGAVAARLAGVTRIVYTEHGREHWDPPLARWLDRQAARWTEAIIPVSHRLRTYMGDALGLDDDRVRVIDNGVDTNRFRPGPEMVRASLGLPDTALVVGSVGRLEQVKAYDRLIRAFADLGDRSSDGRPLALVICGDGSSRPELERLVGDLGIRDRVRLPGWVAAPEDYYRAFDVFAMTSLSEGASVSLLEAMASGAAPVVTAVGANADLLGPALSAWVIPGDDQSAYAAALGRLVGNPPARREAGVAARARVEERFSLARLLREYRRVYVAGATDTTAAAEPY